MFSNPFRGVRKKSYPLFGCWEKRERETILWVVKFDYYPTLRKKSTINDKTHKHTQKITEHNKTLDLINELYCPIFPIFLSQDLLCLLTLSPILVFDIHLYSYPSDFRSYHLEKEDHNTKLRRRTHEWVSKEAILLALIFRFSLGISRQLSRFYSMNLLVAVGSFWKVGHLIKLASLYKHPRNIVSTVTFCTLTLLPLPYLLYLLKY